MLCVTGVADTGPARMHAVSLFLDTYKPEQITHRRAATTDRGLTASFGASIGAYRARREIALRIGASDMVRQAHDNIGRFELPALSTGRADRRRHAGGPGELLRGGCGPGTPCSAA